MPQVGWLKWVEMYPLMVLEARSPESKCWAGHAPSEDSRKRSFLASSRFGGPSWLGFWQYQSKLYFFLLCVCRCPNFPLLIKIPIRFGFPGGLVVKNPPANAGDLGSIPGSGRSPGEGNGNLLQYSCLENPHGQRGLAGYSP